MNVNDCTLCQILSGSEPGKVIWENNEFVCVENKYSHAPVHILVLPKQHLEKKQVREGKIPGFHEKMMSAVFEVVRHLSLETKGYQLINNGAGYNHFEHEHWHILSGLSGKQQ